MTAIGKVYRDYTFGLLANCQAGQLVNWLLVSWPEPRARLVLCESNPVFALEGTI
jgi:hypothetical protein